jgi:hypothetical protein
MTAFLTVEDSLQLAAEFFKSAGLSIEGPASDSSFEQLDRHDSLLF